jgi:hypothetical protein
MKFHKTLPSKNNTLMEYSSFEEAVYFDVERVSSSYHDKVGLFRN